MSDKYTVWKWLLVLVLVSASLVLVTPPGEKIRLGLDLQGGTAFVVEIDQDAIESELRERLEQDEQITDIEAELRRLVPDALRDAQERALEVIRNRIDGLGIAEPSIYPEGRDRIVIQLPGIGEEQRDEAERSIKSAAFLEFRMVIEESEALVSELFERREAPAGFRIDQLEDRGSTRSYLARENAQPLDAAERERVGRFRAPRGAELLLERVEIHNRTVYRPHYVNRRREMTGDALRNARIEFQEHMQPIVALEFTREGRRQFARLTSDYAPGGARNPRQDTLRALAIVLDGTLYSAPVIQEAIYGGNAIIRGQFDREEAVFLANVLRAGSLPAPVTVVERRIVDPTLGADSIRRGRNAMIVGGLMVIVFMAIYYTLAGVIANVALILDLVLLPLGMVLVAGFLGIFAGPPGETSKIALPVLTLPGIAGILLTIGMAVDANVLIFERIREEMRTGKRLAAAIPAGYDKAFVAILDANVTTFLTAVILFLFGTGPIRGFAITLCAGILVSMFTAVVFTRMVFNLLIDKFALSKVRMFSFFGDLKIDFMSKRHLCLAVSVGFIILTMGTMVFRGIQDQSQVLGVDFTGGAALTFRFDERPDLDAVRSVIAESGVPDAHPQFQEDLDAERTEYLAISASSGTGDIIRNALVAAFPEAGFRLLQEDDVGPKVGGEMRQKAMWAILWALAGIILYLSWRFEFGFAVGAIAALVHDVLFTIGLYSLLGLQVNLPTVAALLAIVGYSVNDTIVIFDRIREDLRAMRGKPLVEVANLSINQTLSRTVLTSFTTLIVILMLLIFGGGAIFDFALALLIGILVGTYSSIFVATPTMLRWHKNRKLALAKPRA